MGDTSLTQYAVISELRDQLAMANDLIHSHQQERTRLLALLDQKQQECDELKRAAAKV